MATTSETSGGSNETPRNPPPNEQVTAKQEKQGTPGKQETPAKQERQAAISITVKGQDGSEIVFKVKPTTLFEKVFKAYCDKKAVSVESVRFLYDGDRVKPEQTPVGIGLEDGDMIDAMIQQLGGCNT